MIYVDANGEISFIFQSGKFETIEMPGKLIRRIGYDFETKDLDVHFKSGEASTYTNVPDQVFAHLYGAGSRSAHASVLDPLGRAFTYLILDRADQYPKKQVVLPTEPAEEVKEEPLTDELVLSPNDEKALMSLELKLDQVRLNTVLVAIGDLPGFAVYGTGGIGKSFTVLETLNNSFYNFHLINTRMSGVALVHALLLDPKGLFVVEDLEGLTSDKVALAALRSALAGQTDKKGITRRIVRYTTAKEDITFEFEGGIIFTGNRPWGDGPEMAALKTRIPTVHLQPTRQEMLALGKKISLEGIKLNGCTLTPSQCLEVFNFYAANLPQHKIPDLRTLQLGFKYYRGAALSNMTWQTAFLFQIRSGGTENKPTSSANNPAFLKFKKPG